MIKTRSPLYIIYLKSCVFIIIFKLVSDRWSLIEAAVWCYLLDFLLMYCGLINYRLKKIKSGSKCVTKYKKKRSQICQVGDLTS